MVRMLVKACLVVVLLAGCGGGMNSSNPEAPKANQAHEATWVTYHRDSLFNFKTTTQTAMIDDNGFAVYSSGQAMINEHVIQCRVCHGPSLAGSREGYKGSDCLSCHVLDPVIYPVRCYSCHGGSPVVPFDTWFARFSSTRRGVPISQEFKNNVSSKNYHQRNVSPATNHDAVFLPSNDQEVCRRCHDDPTGEQRSLADRHHALMNSNAPWITTDGCFYCHSFSVVIRPDGMVEFDFTPNRNCTSCHN